MRVSQTRFALIGMLTLSWQGYHVLIFPVCCLLTDSCSFFGPDIIRLLEGCGVFHLQFYFSIHLFLWMKPTKEASQPHSVSGVQSRKIFAKTDTVRHWSLTENSRNIEEVHEGKNWRIWKCWQRIYREYGNVDPVKHVWSQWYVRRRRNINY